MNRTNHRYNSSQIYEIVLNLIQKYSGNGRSPSYRMMEYCGSNCKEYKGKGWQLFALILYNLPKNRDLNGPVLSMISTVKRSEYRSNKIYYEHIKLLEDRCIIRRYHSRSNIIVVNPEYIPWFTEHDMRFINDYILPTARQSILERSALVRKVKA